jgi:uncharacterized protein (DUF2267 family)
MSAALPVFVHTQIETYEFIDDVVEELDLQERHHGYSALRAVLHALRDRLPPVSAVHLSAQMPMLLRGIFFEGWRIAASPTRERSADEFVAHVEDSLPSGYPLNAWTTTRGVLAVLWERMDSGEIDNAISALPEPIKRLWPNKYKAGA